MRSRCRSGFDEVLESTCGQDERVVQVSDRRLAHGGVPVEVPGQRAVPSSAVEEDFGGDGRRTIGGEEVQNT